MKIATWNVERLEHRKYLDEIIDICNGLEADILVLTENDDAIDLDYKYCCHTPTPPPFDRDGSNPIIYEPSEHRVSIYSKYKIKCQHETYDKYTALCLELETGKGNILVYGTIMGIHGNRRPSFEEDLKKQVDDFNRLSEEGHNICICGDYNCSFADNYYFTHSGRNLITKTFTKCGIQLVTAGCWQGIDHIAISNEFIGGSPMTISEFHTEKRLSDHKGVSVQFD